MIIQRRILLPAAQRQICTDWSRGRGSHRKKREVRKTRCKGGGSSQEQRVDHQEDGGKRRSRPPGGVLISWNVCDVAELSGLMTVALNKYLTGTNFGGVCSGSSVHVSQRFFCKSDLCKRINIRLKCRKGFFGGPKLQLQLCQLSCSQVCGY